MAEATNGKYRSRKFILAYFVELAATLVLFAACWGVYPNIIEVDKIFDSWWLVSGTVLGLYGAGNIIDKRSDNGGK